MDYAMERAMNESSELVGCFITDIIKIADQYRLDRDMLLNGVVSAIGIMIKIGKFDKYEYEKDGKEHE